jgi:membrane-bound inhibitor of C-type lysozyme
VGSIRLRGRTRERYASPWLLIAGALLPIAAAGQNAPRELELRCSELPPVEVTVDGQGQVSSRERVAEEFTPVEVRIENSQHLSGGTVVAARVESAAPFLETEFATWTAGDSVVADDGRLRFDIASGVLYLTETSNGNQALFRRFECDRTATPEETGGPAHTRYDCGDGYELEVTLEKGDFGENTVFVLFPEGQFRLPQIPAASGARYADQDSELWIKGEEALFTAFDQKMRHCTVMD